MSGTVSRIASHAAAVAAAAAAVVIATQTNVPATAARLGVGLDLDGYLAAGRRFLDTGTPYAAMQFGPYNPFAQATAAVFLHPPTALFLVLPFLVLPALLWWAIPLGALAWVVVGYRPAPWAWAVVALAAVWPRTVGSLVTGNSDMWVAAGVALGLRFGWPAVLVLVKPTLAPLALAGSRRRSWWVAMAVLAVVSLAMLPLWLDWVAVIRNGSGLGLAYSMLNLPLPAVALVAWAGRTRDPRTAKGNQP